MRTLIMILVLLAGNFELQALERQRGPVTVPVGDFADWKVPEGHFWFPPSELAEFFSTTHTLAQGDELGVLGRGGDQFYALVVRFEAVGKVADPAHDVTDAYLGKFNSDLDAENAKRAAIQAPQVGRSVWAEGPSYDAKTGRLTFCVLMSQVDKGVPSTVANYCVELFGKRGVVKLTVVCEEAAFAAVKADVQGVLDGFQFRPGEGYFDADSAGSKTSGNGTAPGSPFSLLKIQLIGGALVAVYLLWKKRAGAKRARLEELRAQSRAGQASPPSSEAPQ